MVLMHTDFPDPVTPAMRRCGTWRDPRPRARLRRSCRGRSAGRASGDDTRRPRSARGRAPWRGIGSGLRYPRPPSPGSAPRCAARGAHRERQIVGEGRNAAYFHPGPGATRIASPPARPVRPAIEPSTRNVCSLLDHFRPICSICASPASPSSGGAGCSRSMGGNQYAFGDNGRRACGGVSALGIWGRGDGDGRSGRLTSASHLSPFLFPIFPAALLRAFSPTTSWVLKAASGCQPTVRIPSAESANRHQDPARRATPGARHARAARVRNRPASASGSRRRMPAGSSRPSRCRSRTEEQDQPAPSAAARPADRLPRRSNAASAQPMPRRGRRPSPRPTRATGASRSGRPSCRWMAAAVG